jgi:phosphatidylglycerophosphatase A
LVRLSAAAKFIASFGGIGYLPKAPGTWGSLAGLVLGVILLEGFGRAALATGVVLSIGAGFWAIPRAGGDADPGWVVIDEVAGMLVAMLPLIRLSVPDALAAFAFFRLFDITKPGPVGSLDRVPGRVGIIADDLAAGIGAAVCVWLFQQVLAG